ncbi:MAG: hypothetical protein CK519_00940 [Opitutia bacterium]|nr:MAG: hypothetical protein CK519_00940 [Opitutae bacterium]
MASESKGVIGSLAVHIGIIAVLVGASWYAARQSGKSLEPVDPLLVDLNGIPGRRPGEVGKADGVAQGQETGTRKGVSMVKMKKFDFEKNTQEPAAQSESSRSQTSKKATSKNPSKTTLSEFNNAKGGKGTSTKVAGISGVSVKAGRNYGKGDNGGEGGSASELQIYAGEVKARFQSALTSLASAEVDLGSGNCGVVLKVDAGGNVNFSSWINKPKNSQIATLVKQAVAQIGNCGSPPGKKSFQIDLTSITLSDF